MSSPPADRFDGVTEPDPIDVERAVNFLAGENAGIHTGTKHRRRKPRPFFVGPIHHRNRHISFEARFHNGPQRFEPAQYAQNTIEFSASRLRIEMTAHRDRIDPGPFPRPNRKHIPDLVHDDFASKRLGLLLKPMANCGVLFRQGQTLNPPLWSGTEPPGFHDTRPESIAVDS